MEGATEAVLIASADSLEDNEKGEEEGEGEPDEEDEEEVVGEAGESCGGREKMFAAFSSSTSSGSGPVA